MIPLLLLISLLTGPIYGLDGGSPTASITSHGKTVEIPTEHRSSFTTTSTNVQSRSATAPIMYAQSRDSYGQVQSSGGYGAGGGGGGAGSGGSSGASSSYGVPSSSASNSYGVPQQQQNPNQNGQGSMTYYYYHYPAPSSGYDNSGLSHIF